MLRRGPAVLAALVLLGGCTGGSPGRGSGTVTSSRTAQVPPSAGRSSTAASGGPAEPSCPSRYRAPDPHRPRMQLHFTVAPDLSTVHGTERIAFTPDRPINQLVFRLTANTRPTVAAGNRIVVRLASADHGAEHRTFSAANADPSTQGGLLHIPFRTQIAAGTTVHATLSFDVTLGPGSFDRFGRSGGYAYFGSAQPLLAWQRGYGWHTEDMIDFTAESATSEAMDVDMTVTAPAGDAVIASGDPAAAGSGATRDWTSHVDAARDVSVAVGPFHVSDTTVDGVKLHLGAYRASVRDQLVPEFQRAIRRLSALYGPFPFPSLSVARLPASGGGIEYPSSILMLDGSRLVAVHETAHQWYYGLVGDSQAQHPWLDEAFAQYSEERVNGEGASENGDVSGDRHPVDASTESYGDNSELYYFTTYNKGAAALLAARRAAGGARWDAALRCYVAANAWRIVVPGDLERALRALPRAVAVLRRAGAL